MRIALIAPIAFPSVRGNAVTVGRLFDGLRERGVTAETVDLSRMSPEATASRLAAFSPDIVHALHAYRGAPAAAVVTRARGVPLVISLTGTDANIDLFHPERRAATIASIREARALIAFHETIRAKVAHEVPDVASRIEVIPQSVVLGDEPCQLGELVPRSPGEMRFLLPAGIRRVKNVLLPIPPLQKLAQRYPLRFLVVGPVIEEAEGARLAAALNGAEWGGYLGEVPHAQMGSLLDQVDVVINSSLSEGGMANSVLEAMARGKPVLASDIEGNRSVIANGVDGLLFSDAAEFERQAERIIRDPDLRARLGAAGRAKVTRLYPPEREIEGHLVLYRRLLAR
ncbi:MAG: glycosyltransferase family 4 protein [Candidatus Rokubacteria bacterium]|nr:glycosyltransferase family 4 protein [Candidatus Rokubacteria bacterium]